MRMCIKVFTTCVGYAYVHVYAACACMYMCQYARVHVCMRMCVRVHEYVNMCMRTRCGCTCSARSLRSFPPPSVTHPKRIYVLRARGQQEHIVSIHVDQVVLRRLPASGGGGRVETGAGKAAQAGRGGGGGR